MRGNIETLRRAAKLLDAYEAIWRERTNAIESILAEDAEKGTQK